MMQAEESSEFHTFCRQVADNVDKSVVSFDPFSILTILLPVFLSCLNDNDSTGPSQVSAWIVKKNKSDRFRLLKRFAKNAITKSKKMNRKDATCHVLTELEAYELAATTIDTAVAWESTKLNAAATVCMQSA